MKTTSTTLYSLLPVLKQLGFVILLSCSFNSVVHAQQVLNANKKTIVKPLVIYTNFPDDLTRIPLSDSLKVSTDPETHVVVSKLSRSFLLTLEENQQYRISIRYPGYENQFYEFNSSQVPQYDSLYSFIFPSGTPFFYTSYTKRWYEPDSLSIVILGNRYYRKAEFDKYISDLGLECSSTTYSNYFHKKSGEPFDLYNDSIMAELRKPSPIIEAAGINVGTPESISLLTNRIHIEWKSTDQSAIDVILNSYKLKEIGNGFYEAFEGIGFGMNTMAEELNQKQEVRLAYPELFHVIYPD